MKRNEFIGILVGLLLVAVLMFINKEYPQMNVLNVLPGFILIPLAVVAVVYTRYRQKKKERNPTITFRIINSNIPLIIAALLIVGFGFLSIVSLYLRLHANR